MEIVVLSIVLGVIFAAAIRYAERWFRRRGGRPTEGFGEWREEFRQRMDRVIDADYAAAEAKVELAEMVGRIPPDFDPTVWLACQVGQAHQREVLAEAERRGIVPEGFFRRVYGTSLDEAISQAPTTPEAPTEAVPEERPKVLRLGDRVIPRWRKP
jgi:hypothetical protein